MIHPDVRSAAANILDIAESIDSDMGEESITERMTDIIANAQVALDLLGKGEAVSHTPYDTGAVLEPFPWVHKDGTTGTDRRPCEDDDYGRVDFDNDEGATIVTLRVTRDGDRYVLEIYGNDEDLDIQTYS